MNALSESMEICSSRSGVSWSVNCSRGKVASGPSQSATPRTKGTHVTFVPDPQIFNGLRVDVDSLKRLFRQAPYLFPGLRMQLLDEEIFAPNGLSDLVPELTEDMKVAEAEPVFSFSGHDEIVEMHVAVAGRAAKKTTWRTWCNGSMNDDHGTHREGLSDALRSVTWQPAVALIHVILHDPRYAGPTRNVLDVPEIRKVISKMLTEPLREFVAKHQLG